MAGTNKLIVQGFGPGSTYGTPTTIALAQTSTLSVTSSLTGEYCMTGLVAGVSLTQISTTNGVTGTFTVLSAAPGRVFLDGASNFLVNTTTSVNIVVIGT